VSGRPRDPDRDGGANARGHVAAQGPDLRLLVPALAGWAAAFWATSRSPDTVVVAAVAAVVAATVAAGLLARLRLRHRSGIRFGVRSGVRDGGRSGVRERAQVASRVTAAPTSWLAATVLLLAVVAGVLACTAYRLSARASGPLPGWLRDRATVELTGQALGDPRPVASGRFPGPPRVAVLMRVHRVVKGERRATTSLPMLVLAPAGSGPGAWSAVTAGQQVQWRGRLTPSQPGDEAAALISARGAPQRIARGSWPWRMADRIRAGLRTSCRGLSRDSSGLLPSLVVGDTAALPIRLQEDLKAAGLTHLTAVSGANVAIFVGAVAWLSAAAGAGRRFRLVVSGLAVAGFVVLARPSPSVVRAAAMAGVALVGLASARRPRGLPVLATAIVVLLAGNPWLSRNPGFVLSCAATGGLLLLAPVWADRLTRRMPRPLALALAAPAAAQAACGPVLVLMSPSVSLAAVPANLLAEPAVAPATLLGVAAAALSQVWPSAAHATAWVGSLATDWIALVAHRGAAVPLANLPWPGGLGGAGLLAGLTAGLIAVTARPRHSFTAVSTPSAGPVPSAGPASGGGSAAPGVFGTGRASSRRPVPQVCRWWTAWPVVGVGTAVLVAAVVGWIVFPVAGRFLSAGGLPAGWLVVMCDVGQGDAVVVRSGRDRAVLVDTGPQPDAVDRCLRRLGVRHLDLVVVTHLHADHAFGLPGALRGRDAAAVWVSPLQEPPGNAEAVRRWAAAGGLRPVQAWAGAEGGSGRDGWAVRWRVLEPRVPPTSAGDVSAADGAVVNESSVAMLMEVTGPAGAVRLLDLGDLETERQEGLAERLGTGGETLGGPVDVVKVSHHGSSRQSRTLYASSGARLGLVGVGAGNDYGHPSAAALAMLSGTGIRALRTDLSGDLVVERTPAGIRVTGTRS
jgi:competence protein ComEC